MFGLIKENQQIEVTPEGMYTLCVMQKEFFAGPEYLARALHRGADLNTLKPFSILEFSFNFRYYVKEFREVS